MADPRLKFLDEPPIPFDNARFTREAEEKIAIEEAERQRHERAVQYVKQYNERIEQVAKYGYVNQKEPLPEQPKQRKARKPPSGWDWRSQAAYDSALEWAKQLKRAIAQDNANASSPAQRWLFWSDDGLSLVMRQRNGFDEAFLNVQLPDLKLNMAAWDKRMLRYGFKKPQETFRQRKVPIVLTHPNVNRDTTVEDAARAMMEESSEAGGKGREHTARQRVRQARRDARSIVD